MLEFLSVLQYLVLTLWIGAMFAFGALFAPVLFRSLSSRDQAGTIAGEMLARIDTLGLISGGILLVVTILQAIDSGWVALDFIRFVLVGVMLAVVTFQVVNLRSRLATVRQQMGRPIDEFSNDDPMRAEYNKIHKMSRGLFSLTLLLGVALLVLSALRPFAAVAQ